MSRDYDHLRRYPPVHNGHGNGSSFRVPIIAAFIGLLILLGAGFRYLDDKKADKEAVTELRADVKAIRDYLMPERAERRPR